MVDCKEEKRSNATHRNTTDPKAKLSYGGHAVMENGSGLCVDLLITDAHWLSIGRPPTADPRPAPQDSPQDPGCQQGLPREGLCETSARAQYPATHCPH